MTSPAKAGWTLTAGNFGGTTCETSTAAAPNGALSDTHDSPPGTHTVAKFAWKDPNGAPPNNAVAQHQFTVAGSVEDLFANVGTAYAEVTAFAAKGYLYRKHVTNNVWDGYYTPVPDGTVTELVPGYQPITYYPLTNTYTANVDFSFFLRTEANVSLDHPFASATAKSVAGSIGTVINGIKLADVP